MVMRTGLSAALQYIVVVLRCTGGIVQLNRCVSWKRIVFARVSKEEFLNIVGSQHDVSLC